jgi:preprotein translocase subunit Sss1
VAGYKRKFLSIENSKFKIQNSKLNTDMIQEVYPIWKDFWKWLNRLSKKTIALTCAGCSVIGCMGFVIFMLLNMNTAITRHPVMDELCAIRAEFAGNDSIIREEIRAVAQYLNSVEAKLTKVILIEAARSNSELIRSLVPWLENTATERDIYDFILDMERGYRQGNPATPDISEEKK